jgi:Fic family protein
VVGGTRMNLSAPRTSVLSMTSAARDGTYSPFPDFADWAPEFDSTAVDRYDALLAADKSTTTPEALQRAVEVASRYAAVDTGAIEGLYTTNRGFTRTIATQAAAWEAALSQQGEHVARSIDDALKGYEMVLDAVTEASPISEAWVRMLHEILCASQETYAVHTAVGIQHQPLPKGSYETMPNNPTSMDTGHVHHYAPVSDTPGEMERLIAQVRCEDFVSAHPVLQAAYAHYAFVCIHPFADGDGRVSRALASLFLYRSPGVPLVIFADQKDLHIDALEAADGGDPRPFVQLIADRTMDAVELVRGALSAAGEAGDAMARLRGHLEGRGGLTHIEYDAMSARINQALQTRLQAHLDGRDLPAAVNVQVSPQLVGSVVPPEGFRTAGAAGFLYQWRVTAPTVVQRDVTVMVFAADMESVGADFAVVSSGFDRPLHVFLREIHPHATRILDLKIESWISAAIDADLGVVEQAVGKSLMEGGYRPKT